MRIEGLTKRQVKIADTLWSLGTTEDCQRWLSILSPEIRLEALVVMELMLQAVGDEMIEQMDYYPEAMEVIEKVQKM